MTSRREQTRQDLTPDTIIDVDDRGKISSWKNVKRGDKKKKK